MSIKKTVHSVAARLSKESGGGKGINNEGELHHIEIHPAENGFRVEHHTHKKREKHMDYEPYGTDKEEHVFETHHKALKHVKGIMEEHADSMDEEGEQHQSGVLIGKRDKRSKEENGTGA